MIQQKLKYSVNGESLKMHIHSFPVIFNELNVSHIYYLINIEIRKDD